MPDGTTCLTDLFRCPSTSILIGMQLLDVCANKLTSTQKYTLNNTRQLKDDNRVATQCNNPSTNFLTNTSNSVRFASVKSRELSIRNQGQVCRVDEIIHSGYTYALVVLKSDRLYQQVCEPKI